MIVEKKFGYVVDYGGFSFFGNIQFVGYIFFLGNIFFMLVYIFFQKKFIFDKEDLCWKIKFVNVIVWSYLFGVMFMVLVFFYYVSRLEKFMYFFKEEIYFIFYVIFIVLGLCYLLILWCNMQIFVLFVIVIWFFQVLFCVILLYFVLGEVLKILEYLGGVFIVVGLMVVVWLKYVEEK